jgi:hypothetical protein
MCGKPTDITTQSTNCTCACAETPQTSPHRAQTVPRSVYLAYNTSQEGPKTQPWNNRVPTQVLKIKGASFHTLTVTSYQSVTGSANHLGTEAFTRRQKLSVYVTKRTTARVRCQHCITADDESIGLQLPPVSPPFHHLTLAHTRTRDKCASGHVYLKTPSIIQSYILYKHSWPAHSSPWVRLPSS